jgi:hypothetical protein
MKVLGMRVLAAVRAPGKCRLPVQGLKIGDSAIRYDVLDARVMALTECVGDVARDQPMRRVMGNVHACDDTDPAITDIRAVIRGAGTVSGIANGSVAVLPSTGKFCVYLVTQPEQAFPRPPFTQCGGFFCCSGRRHISRVVVKIVRVFVQRLGDFVGRSIVNTARFLVRHDTTPCAIYSESGA